MVIPVSEKSIEYANKVKEELENNDIRVEVDDRNEKMGYKIREAQTKKIPYMLVIGNKEVENGTVSVRSRKQADMGSMPVDDFIKMALEEIATKKK